MLSRFLLLALLSVVPVLRAEPAPSACRDVYQAAEEEISRGWSPAPDDRAERLRLALVAVQGWLRSPTGDEQGYCQPRMQERVRQAVRQLWEKHLLLTPEERTAWYALRDREDLETALSGVAGTGAVGVR